VQALARWRVPRPPEPPAPARLLVGGDHQPLGRAGARLGGGAVVRRRAARQVNVPPPEPAGVERLRDRRLVQAIVLRLLRPFRRACAHRSWSPTPPPGRPAITGRISNDRSTARAECVSAPTEM